MIKGLGDHNHYLPSTANAIKKHKCESSLIERRDDLDKIRKELRCEHLSSTEQELYTEPGKERRRKRYKYIPPFASPYQSS